MIACIAKCMTTFKILELSKVGQIVVGGGWGRLLKEGVLSLPKAFARVSTACKNVMF